MLVHQRVCYFPPGKLIQIQTKRWFGSNSFKTRLLLGDILGIYIKLGGGFKHFLFSVLGEKIQLDQYFSNGLKPPTSRFIYLGLFSKIDTPGGWNKSSPNTMYWIYNRGKWRFIGVPLLKDEILRVATVSGGGWTQTTYIFIYSVLWCWTCEMHIFKETLVFLATIFRKKDISLSCNICFILYP